MVSLNWSMLQRSRDIKRRPAKALVNPIEQVDLDSLRIWSREDPFPCQKLAAKDQHAAGERGVRQYSQQQQHIGVVLRLSNSWCKKGRQRKWLNIVERQEKVQQQFIERMAASFPTSSTAFFANSPADPPISVFTSALLLTKSCSTTLS
jgi:hypothetical protein